MSEPKEIPSVILDAATATILQAQAYGTGEDVPTYTRKNFQKHGMLGAWNNAARYAQADMEAAGVADMLIEIGGLRFLIADAHAETRQAKARIAELEAQIVTIRNTIEAHDVRLESCDRDGQEFCDCIERALKSAISDDTAAMVADRERIGLALFQNGYDDGYTTDGAIEAIEMMAARIAELEAGIAKMQARPTTAELFSAGVV